MSRTNRGSKAAGYDYWSKRSKCSSHVPIGRIGKKITSSKEREAQKKDLRKQIKEEY